MAFNNVFLLLAIVANILALTLAAEPPFEYRRVLETDFRADNYKYRLPNDTVPEAYDISLTTRIDLAIFDFDGLVKIDVNVLKTTREIVLHARQLTIKNIRLYDHTGNIPLLSHEYDVVPEFLKIPTDNVELIQGRKYFLEISYSGVLRSDNHGFYRSSYINEEEEQKWLAVTQFESTDARHGFPCYDEPALKARFTIHIQHGASYNAISNMPETRTTNTDRTVTTHFGTTPLTSPYLIAFVISDFKYKTNTNSTDVFRHRVYANPVEVENTALALEEGEKILNAIANYLQVPFSLPKMDQVGLKDFAAGAMENWGLVTYKDKYFLYNANYTQYNIRTFITTIIAHEFGHQWFGNLVSPKWWSYLWLNEGFANLFEHIGTDLVHPEWHIFDYYVVATLQKILNADGTKATRPMTFYVESPNLVAHLFDFIAYGKSGSVLRMFSHALTENTFKKGLKYYLTEKSYNSAIEDDLFLALERAAKEDKTLNKDLRVQDLFKSWSNQNGFPLLTIKRDYDNGTITITQQRYYNVLEGNEGDPTTWWIPYNFAWTNHSRTNNTAPDGWLQQNSRSKAITPSADHKWTDKDWVLFNIQQTGFYRVQYDERNWNLLIQHLSHGDLSQIHPSNRAQLLDDAYSFLNNKLISHTLYFNLLAYLPKELSYTPWAPASVALFEFNRKLLGSKQHESFKKFAASCVSNVYTHVSAVEKTGEPHFTNYLRAIATTAACEFGIEQCRNETYLKFKEFLANTKSISQNIRPSILGNGIRSANASEVKQLWDIFTRTSQEDVRLEIISSFGNIQDEQVMSLYLNRTIVDNMRFTQAERRVLFTSISAGSLFGQSICIRLFVNHMDLVKKQLGDLNSLVLELSKQIVTHDVHSQFNNLVSLAKKNAYISEKTVEVAESTIKTNFNWLSTHQKGIETWISNYRKPLSGSDVVTKNIFLIISMVIVSILYHY